MPAAKIIRNSAKDLGDAVKREAPPEEKDCCYTGDRGKKSSELNAFLTMRDMVLLSKSSLLKGAWYRRLRSRSLIWRIELEIGQESQSGI